MSIYYNEQLFHISNYGTGHYYGSIGGPTKRQMLAKRNGIIVTYDKGKDNDATLRVKLKQAYVKKCQKGIAVDVRMKQFNSDFKDLKKHGSVMVAI